MTDPDPATTAETLAAEAISNCNVRWSTAIDSPAVVASVAIGACRGTIEAEARAAERQRLRQPLWPGDLDRAAALLSRSGRILSQRDVLATAGRLEALARLLDGDTDA